MAKKLQFIMLFSFALTVGCRTGARTSSSDYFPFLKTLKSYTTFWYAFDDSSFKFPGDSLNLSLSRYGVDSLVYPHWHSLSTSLDYVVKERSVVSLEILTMDGKRRTQPIRDTLDRANYGFMLNDIAMPSGVYLWRKAIGSETTVKKFILMK